MRAEPRPAVHRSPVDDGQSAVVAAVVPVVHTGRRSVANSVVALVVAVVVVVDDELE